MVGIGGSGQRILVEFDKSMDTKLAKQGHEKGVHTYTGLIGWLGKMLGFVKEIKVGNETLWVGAESAKKFAFRHGVTPKTGDWKGVNVDDALKNVAKTLEQAKHEKVTVSAFSKSDAGFLTSFKNQMDRIGVKLDDREFLRFVGTHSENDKIDFNHQDFDDLVGSADMSRYNEAAVKSINNDELRAAVEAVVRHIKHVQGKKPDALSGKPASPSKPSSSKKIETLADVKSLNGANAKERFADLKKQCAIEGLKHDVDEARSALNLILGQNIQWPKGALNNEKKQSDILNMCNQAGIKDAEFKRIVDKAGIHSFSITK